MSRGDFLDLKLNKVISAHTHTYPPPPLSSTSNVLCKERGKSAEKPQKSDPREDWREEKRWVPDSTPAGFGDDLLGTIHTEDLFGRSI